MREERGGTVQSIGGYKQRPRGEEEERRRRRRADRQTRAVLGLNEEHHTID